MVSVHSTLLPLCQFGRIFGLIAFSPRKKQYISSNFSIIWCVLTFLLVTIYSLGLLIWQPVTSLYENDGDEDEYVIVSVADSIEAYTSTFAMSVSYLYCVIRRDKMMGIVNSLGRFDNTLSKLNIDINQTTKYGQYKVVMGLILIVIYFITYFSLEMTVFNNDSMLHILMYTMPSGVTSFVVLQFAILMIILKKRLETINGYFLHCLSKMERSLFETNVPYITTSLFSENKTKPNEFDYSLDDFPETICKLHYKLFEIGNDISKAFSIQILFIIVQSLVTLISTAFYLVSILLSRPKIGAWMFVYTIYVCLFCMSQIITVVVVSIIINIKSKQTGKILFKTKEYFNGKQFKQKLYFSFQLIHNNVDFEACRGFPIDGKLLLTIMGSVTTYLLIVIQFQMHIVQDKQIMSSTEDTLSNTIINK